MTRWILIEALLLFPFHLMGQSVHVQGKNDTITLPAYINGTDTIPHIWIQEAEVTDTKIFHNRREKVKYDKLKRDVLKVLPYAKLGAYRYRELEIQLRSIATEKERKALIKAVEQEIKTDFAKDLKQLTIKQGAILIKLFDRETGQTGYDALKEMKSNLSAIFWQSLARVFGQNLKATYDPEEEKEIENIIRSVGDPDYEQAKIEYEKYMKNVK